MTLWDLERKPQLLVVEDDQDLAEMLSLSLKTAGAEVHQASWGEEAVRLCSRINYDLVLLDIELSDIDGYEVLRRISAGNDAPIIIMTAQRGQIPQLAKLVHKPFSYLIKPFVRAKLELRVRNALVYRSKQIKLNRPDVAPVPTGAQANDSASRSRGNGVEQTNATAAQVDVSRLMRLANDSPLRQVLTERFDIEEFRSLCVDLDVKFDSLRGEGQEAKARELIDHLQRRERLGELVSYIRRHRPDIKL